MDHEDLNQPEKSYIYSDMVQVSSTSYKRNWYYFRNIIYDTDEGLIFPKSNIRSIHSFAGTREATDFRIKTTIPGTFSVVSLNNYPLKQIFKRRYYKVQNMMADLGGIIKGLIIIAKIFYFFSGWNMYTQDIVNHNISNFKNLIDSKEQIVISKKRSKSIELIRSNIARTDGNMFEKNKINIFQLNANSNLSSKSQVVVIKKSREIKFSCFETYFPSQLFSKSKNIRIHNLIYEKIKEQLDLKNIIQKLNNIDKLIYIILGDYGPVLNIFNNPILKQEEIKSEFDEIDQKRLCEFSLENNMKNLLKNSEKAIE